MTTDAGADAEAVRYLQAALGAMDLVGPQLGQAVAAFLATGPADADVRELLGEIDERRRGFHELRDTVDWYLRRDARLAASRELARRIADTDELRSVAEQVRAAGHGDVASGVEQVIAEREGGPPA